MARSVDLRWLDQHDGRNAVTAIRTAAALLDDRWDELTEEQRRDLVATLRKRADQVGRLLNASRG
ncbi:MAG TPA: hypothetical protein VM345_16080 [Acidimicrobiales bacterium]|nr:hypothetical protein [Acidimicrobiales bacterium]